MIDFLKHMVSLHNYALVLLGVTVNQNFLFVNPLSYAIITIVISAYYINKRRQKREQYAKMDHNNRVA